MSQIQKETKYTVINKPRFGYPLVSIIVITYNSSKYVLETLESAKAQTYQKTELIVSDDCSTDNTVKICREWIEKYGEGFVRTELITVRENTGISANCNRGIKAAEGEWMKLIAGDDILLPNCIFDNIDQIIKNNNISFLFSEIHPFSDSQEEIHSKYFNTKYDFFKLTAIKQFKKLVIENRIITPSAFLRVETLRKIGGYDENIRNVEDYPLWIKATKNGYKLFYFNKVTVKYRIHENSMTTSASKTKIANDLEQIFLKYNLPYISITNFLFVIDYYLMIKSIKSLVYKLIRFFSPIYYYRGIKKHWL